MKENLEKYLPEISGAVIGLLLAFCFIGLGFYKTIFVIVMLVCGALVGHYWPLLKNLKNR
ncbi:Uncharacterized membrane protein [Lactobacillus bombicola]|jgi:uncharacterized membrane protein|uniref:DUF2273 domain-containing protein n=1 Tax=Lactobacillus bombicola TaxID=1505723 RepID=A0A1I1SSF3_9LACO|nr:MULTISPECIES: DUF2273 domain-containing protein [Lactobacillus]MCO6527531.1 DUF2273 domain-containing protein [Lactobacillus sp.]RHW50368.1 DUF2273 domain-containing protein [Lactobacillus bombicola]RHW52615.1 DUF2273 domain-containing protein [Lactobacillus bombicola]RHW53806.1 DUF2273 domain-containing protein [Lactobacillus bombicola]RMC38757.1 DUF2273 domain-containing protein [Lactobacillus sp. ESL0237]